MLANKKILFPVDFSEGTQNIVPYVEEMAEKLDAPVLLLYVVHVTPYYEGVGLELSMMADFEETVVNSAKNRMNIFLDRHFKNRTVNGKVIVGYPGEAILEYADMENVGMIIMGHSKKGLQRMIMGSVAAYVVKHSRIPVMIINPNEKAD